MIVAEPEGLGAVLVLQELDGGLPVGSDNANLLGYDALAPGELEWPGKLSLTRRFYSQFGPPVVKVVHLLVWDWGVFLRIYPGVGVQAHKIRYDLVRFSLVGRHP